MVLFRAVNLWRICGRSAGFLLGLVLAVGMVAAGALMLWLIHLTPDKVFVGFVLLVFALLIVNRILKRANH